MIQLSCTHCGNHFELEKKEGALCPACGWSSSVILASDRAQKKSQAASKKPVSGIAAWLPGFLFFVLKFLVLAGVLCFIVWGGLKFWNLQHVQTGKSQNKKAVQNINLNQESPKPVAPLVLTSDEQTALNSKIEISAEVRLEDTDLKLLQRAVDLTAGSVEKLPSGNWTFDQYKQFIEKQEKAFHMPLPRSYKKSLEDLFQKTYATAYDLFLAGKIQQARDAYTASLGFPVYDNDVRKHRAVILTMLRNFINDTIAKIGSMNFALARQNSNGLAEQVSAAYADLQQQIRANQWNEAFNSTAKTAALLPEAQAASLVLQAPTYVAGFEKIDGDIQPVLLKLLQVPAWAFDVNDLRNDLAVKKDLLSKLTDPDRKQSTASYNVAMEKIQAKAWPEALQLLQEVKSPEELKQDADQKIVLIKKLTGAA